MPLVHNQRPNYNLAMQIEVRQIDGDLTLIGTRVVTADALEELEAKIRELSPDVVVLDYDETRWRWLGMLAGEGEVDLVQVIKAGQMSELNARLAMGVLAKSVAPRAGVPLDAEFIRSAAVAEELGAQICFGRRPVEVEAVRGWRHASVGGRFGFAWSLFRNSLRRTQLSEEAQQRFEPQEGRAEGVSRAGQLAGVLFDESATWLAAQAQQQEGTRVVVLPASALDAVTEALEAAASTDGLDHVREKSLFSRAVPWLFTALIIAAFVLGFVFADPEKMQQAAVAWFASNMTFAALGALLALAHPVTIIATSLSAPFVSLNPAIGAGMVGALVQAFVAPPTVRDMDRVGDDISRLRGWWQNRLARLVLIFVFANLFSSIGSFAAFAWFPAGDLAG